MDIINNPFLIIGMNMKRNTLITLLLVNFILHAENSTKADPDYTFTGFEFAGATVVKIGDYVKFKYLETGGFIEVRDEKHFNTKFAPNHNWRGFFFLRSNIPIKDNPEKKIFLNIGYEHESAHPTMGIEDSTADPYIKLYDGQYRVIDLNSLLLRYNRTHFLNRNILSLKSDYQFYFYSKNTPELTKETRSVSNGLSLGLEYTRSINENLSIYTSVFDRYIFKGKKKASGDIFSGNDTLYKAYPVINEINTISAKTGVAINLSKIKRRIEVYCSILYGNIFGFVDSREKRLRVAGGICISS